MPRKPKPPMDFVIESLSNGKLSIPREEGVDDWGELIPVPEIYGPFRPLQADPFVERDAQRKQVVKDKLTLLQALGLVERPESMKPKQVELIPKGKRKIGQIGDKAMLIDMPKWRRL
jgi:hypothetical protein